MRKVSCLGDKALVIAGLAGVIACAWAYLVPASLDMYGRMNGAAAWMMEATWDAGYFLLIFFMWAHTRGTQLAFIGQHLESA